jgi:hypothetical protein
VANTDGPSPLSARVTLAEARLPEEPRRELLRGVTGEAATIGDLRVRAGSLPLFRTIDGRLSQCVRVRLETPAAEATPFAISSGERRLDDATLEAGARFVDLYVPEVAAPETFAVEIGERRVPVRVEPQRKWRVFVVHHSHLDIGYTDPRAAVLRHHADYLDSVLDFAEASDGWPDASRLRWSIESNLVLQRWLAARPADAHRELFERVRSGRIEVCALPFTMHTELLSVDELSRQLEFALQLHEQHGLAVDTAMQTDVPGAVVGLPEALATAGVTALAVAHNYAARATPWLTGGLELPRLFRWEGPSGRRVLVWHTDSPHGVAYLEGNLLGLAESFESARGLLPEYLAALAARPYPYGNLESLGLPADLTGGRQPYPHDILHLRVQGATADNAAPSLRPAEIVRAWNEQWVFPQLRCATNREFFDEAEGRVGAELETVRGDWGDWWVDGAASGSRALGAARRAQARVRTAQTLHVLADALDRHDDRWEHGVERTYDDLALFDEHTWCAANPGGDALQGRGSSDLQWQAKARLAFGAEERADDLVDAASARLGRLVQGPSTALASFVALNVSAGPRSDLARVFVPASRIPLEQPVSVIDATTGERLAGAVEVRSAATERNRPPGRLVSFLARDVPALGYRRYELVAADPHTDARPDADPLVLESDRYRLELDERRGAVTRLIDHRLGIDLVDGASPFPFAAAIYDRYLGSGRSTLRLQAGPPPSFAAAGSSAWLVGSRTFGGWGVVARRVSNAVEERVTIRLQSDGAEWLETTLRLIHGLGRVDLEQRLHKLPVLEKEGLSFAFPFSLASPSIELELTGGVESPTAARVPGGARHVRAMRHWAALHDDTATVAWATREAALVQVGNLHLPFPPYPGTADAVGPATLVSTAMGNAWDTNFPLAQSGETVFAYAIASAAPDTSGRALGVATATALTQPLVAILGARRGAAGLTAPCGSFCALDRRDVELLSLGASRAGHDLVARLHSHASEEVEVALSFPDLPVARIRLGDAHERRLADVRPGDPIRIRPGELLTVALDLSER